MKLTRIVALLVTLAMAVGAVTPALAVDQGRLGPVHSSGMVLPIGQELSDEQMAEIRGEWVPWAVGAILGAATYVVTNWGEEIDDEWAAGLLAATAMGALSGGIGAGLASVTTTSAGTLAAGVYAGALSLTTDAVLAHGSR